MKLRQFECLRALMDTGNMTRAAELLGIAQPSVSSMISNLEHELGFKLFDRRKGRLIATHEAEYILPDILRTLESVEFTRQNARQIRDNSFGDLTIAAFPDIAIDFLPSVISNFLSEHKNVNITLKARRSEMMEGMLPSQQFDMAIVTKLSVHQALDVSSVEQECVLALPEKHPLAGANIVTPQDISGYAFVGLLPEQPIAVEIANIFTDAHILDWKPTIKAQTFESVSSFIRNGAGIGILDPITAHRYAGKGLDSVRFEPKIFRKIYILIPNNRPRSRILELFQKFLQDSLNVF